MKKLLHFKNLFFIFLNNLLDSSTVVLLPLLSDFLLIEDNWGESENDEFELDEYDEFFSVSVVFLAFDELLFIVVVVVVAFVDVFFRCLGPGLLK